MVYRTVSYITLIIKHCFIRICNYIDDQQNVNNKFIAETTFVQVYLTVFHFVLGTEHNLFSGYGRQLEVVKVDF